MNSCPHCHKSDDLIRSLKQELEAKNHQLERMELDLLTLNQKYVAEIERVGNIQHEKDLVEHELEDLSRKLFEEANAMVAIEKRARYQVENELRQTKEYLSQEKNQLHELRLRLTLADDMTENVNTIESKKNSRKPSMRVQMDFEQLHGLKRASANNVLKYNHSSATSTTVERTTLSMPPPPKPKQQHITTTIDEVQLESFREYTIASSKKLLSPKKLNQTNFMKHCLSEDIEPCLRFGPHSKLSVKKMIDFLSRQPCFIEHSNNIVQQSISKQQQQQQQQQYKPLWERFSSNTSTTSIILSNSCSACGRSADITNNNQSVLLNYRFKLDENDNWLLIDQYCRDRLVAVCEFFVFIRNIQLGLYSDRTIEDLYTENIRLKLQMFYSRMGALPVILDDLGLDPNDVGKASEPTMSNEGDDLYLSDSSTTGPNTPEPHLLSPISQTWALDSSTNNL